MITHGPKKTNTCTGKSGGYLVLLILVFGAAFLLIFTSLAGLTVNQKKLSQNHVNRDTAFQIAEAGADYYRWYLAHNPNDLTNGTTSPQPYVHDYHDPEGGKLGEFALTIDGNLSCGEVTSVDITSEGSTVQDPLATRRVFARYARPSVAEYAFIINSNVWAGADREIVGPYHSNGGIRMDGTNNSSVTSGVSSWLCTSSFGCDPDREEDGVFGGGANANLWDFPSIPVDFAGLSADLTAIKDKAKSDGLYFQPTSRGKHLVFLPDGTVDVYIVTSTEWVWGYSTEDGWHQNNHIIEHEAHIGNFTPPSDCQLIFAESDVWIEGTITGKVTVASANLLHPNKNTTVILNDDITYASSDGSVGLTVIAEEDVLVPLLSPEDMKLDGIFMAQNGRFGRNHYTTSGSRSVPQAYDTYVQQDTLTINGTIVSNGRVGTKWTSGGSFVSGYNQRTNTYDRDLATDPPPLTPYVSENHTFVEWRENTDKDTE